MYVRKSADRRSKNLLRNVLKHWRARPLSIAMPQLPEMSKFWSPWAIYCHGKTTEPGLSDNHAQGSKAHCIKTSCPLSLNYLQEATGRKRPATRVLESVGGSWGQGVCVMIRWGHRPMIDSTTIEGGGCGLQDGLWPSTLLLFLLISCSAFHSFKLLFKIKQQSFLSTCSSFLSNPHQKVFVLLGQNSTFHSSFESTPSFFE